MVIKHAEGNNNQDWVWKFCVVEQNVQCWKKQNGQLIKDHKMAKRSPGQKIKCCSQEERNVSFKCRIGH